MSQGFNRRPFPYGGGPDGSDIDWLRVHKARAEVEAVLRRQAQARAEAGLPLRPVGGSLPGPGLMADSTLGRGIPPARYGGGTAGSPELPTTLSATPTLGRTPVGAAEIRRRGEYDRVASSFRNSSGRPPTSSALAPVGMEARVAATGLPLGGLPSTPRPSSGRGVELLGTPLGVLPDLARTSSRALASARLQRPLIERADRQHELLGGPQDDYPAALDYLEETPQRSDQRPELFLLADGKRTGKKSAKTQREEKRAAQEIRRAEELEREKKEHKTSVRPSTQQKHDLGRARGARDQGGEKGDKRRRYDFFPPTRYLIPPNSDAIIRPFLPYPVRRPGESDAEYLERTRPYREA